MAVDSSDGRRVRYSFHEHHADKIHKYYYLTQVKDAEHPDENYEYVRKANGLLHVSRKNLPNGRYIKNSYYQPGINYIGQCALVLEKGDSRVDRVKMQEAPLGTDSSPVVAFQYVYHTNLKRHHTLNGITHVTDALGGLKEYQYDDQHRLTAVISFKGRYGGAPFQKYSMERYFLGAPHISDRNNLLAKTFEDGEGLVEAEGYWYDEAGNVISERLYGNLSGHCTIRPFIDGSGHPGENGCESYGTRYRYSQEFHLPVETIEDNGKRTLIQYINGTELPSSKLLLDHDRIIRREFIEYNELDLPQRTIVDDGTTPDINNLTGVTQRKITYTTPSYKKAPIGLTRYKEERYLDLQTGEERRLRKIHYHYSKQGRVLKEEHYDANNNYIYSLQWDYDSHGNIISETNPLGHLTTMHYDANDNLILKKSTAEPFRTEYTYDFCDRLISQTEIHDDGNYFVTTHRYDYLHNRIATIDHFGNETHYLYDEFNRLIKTISPEVSIENQQTSITQEYDYDIYDNKTISKDGGGRITHTQYNIRGKPIAIHHPNGTTEQFTYNLDGTLKKAIAPNGSYILYTHDILGRPLLEDTYSPEGTFLSRQSHTYNSFHKTSSTNPEGLTTHYHYDYAGRLVATIAGDQEERLSYDSQGRIATITTLFGFQPHEATIKAYRYDLLNRILEERIEDTQGNTLTKVEYDYDLMGNRNLIKEQTATGISLTTLLYNGSHQLIKITDPLGNATLTHYNYHHYNSFQQKVLQITKTDPLGNQTLHTYDPLNRLVEIQQKNPFGLLTSHRKISYDAADNRTKTIDSLIQEGTPQQEIITLWEYNAINQITHLSEAHGTPEQKDTYYLYNSHGQKSTLIKPDQVTIQYTYDPQGRLQTLSSSDQTISYSYSYNKNHQPIEITDLITSQKTIRHYDKHGLLTQETLAHNHTIQYSYDRASRLRTLKLSPEMSWSYRYNAAFLCQIDRLENDAPLYSHHYLQYDPAGLLLHSKLPLQAGEIYYQYDPLKRPTTISSSQWNYSQPTYDPSGNLLQYTIQDNLGTINRHFTYDHLYHLTSETFPNHTYQTNSLHNRTQKNQNPYTTNPLNQITHQQETHYQYDPNGNLSKKIKNDQITHYQYDALDRLIQVTTPQGTTQYTYDPFNRRLTKNNEKYLYQDQNEIATLIQDQITQLRILGKGKGAEIGASIALELHNQLCIPLHDEHGNIVTLLNPQGQVIETYRYSSFGEREIFDQNNNPIAHSTVDNPWFYSSKRYDPEIEAIYFGRRHYDPELGSWLTPDPIGYQDGPNLYAYLNGNPLNAIDLYGLEREDKNSLDGPRHERTSHSPSRTVDRRGNEVISRNHDRTNRDSSWDRTSSGIKGAIHGMIDFFNYSFMDSHRAITSLGLSNSELSQDEKENALATVEKSLADYKKGVDDLVISAFCPNGPDPSYKAFRSYTKIGLEVGSIAAGGYGLAKGAFKFGIKSSARIWKYKFIQNKRSTFISRNTSFAGSKRFQLDYAPYQRIRNEATKIQGRMYRGHALDRMQDRGIMPSAIEDAIKNGKHLPGKEPGTIQVYSNKNNITVIINQTDNQVITTWPGR